MGPWSHRFSYGLFRQWIRAFGPWSTHTHLSIVISVFLEIWGPIFSQVWCISPQYTIFWHNIGVNWLHLLIHRPKWLFFFVLLCPTSTKTWLVQTWDLVSILVTLKLMRRYFPHSKGPQMNRFTGRSYFWSFLMSEKSWWPWGGFVPGVPSPLPRLQCVMISVSMKSLYVAWDRWECSPSSHPIFHGVGGLYHPPFT